MFNVKWAVFPAGGAFLLAFLVNIFGPGDVPRALLHAFIFGVLFFGMGCGAWALINTFIPDLLIHEPQRDVGGGIFQTDFSKEAPPETPATPKVSITVGDSADAALPGDSYGLEGIGNIADLVARPPENAGSGIEAETPAGELPEMGAFPEAPTGKVGDIDQSPVNSYTSDLGDFSFTSDDTEGSDTSLAESGLGDFSSFFDGLTAGDTEDSMGDLFQALSSGRAAGSEEVAPVERKTTGNKSVEMQGDFSPKEIAVGIRTVLAKEKRG